MRIAHAGIRFFFTHVLERNWRTFDYLGAQKEFRLPTVLSREEVRRVLACVYTFTTAPISPPSMPAACACRRRCIWKPPISTATG